MLLTNDVELLDGLPLAYIKSLSSLVIADMHLGYEAISAKRGALLPQVNLKNIEKILSTAMASRKVKTLIVDGDIKNEFSTVDEAEFNELYDFINFILEKNVSLVLIKGNHDNFVERYAKPLNLEVHAQEASIGNYFFFHGEELPKNIKLHTKMLIMGHEHPSIGIYDIIGRLEKLKCFLSGTYKGKKLLVMPAINYFASGTAVNLEPKENLLSPIFKYVDVDNMHAIAIGYGSTIDFGKIKDLKEISRSNITL